MPLEEKIRKNEDFIEEVLGEDRQNDNTDDEQVRLTHSQILISLASDADLFHTSDLTGYATINIDGHYEHWPIKSKQFKHYLVKRFYDHKEKPPGNQALQDALNTLEAKACYEGPELPVFKRIASDEEAVYIDLCDSTWSAIKISSEGWMVVSNPPVKFCRVKGMQPLCVPESGGSIEELKSFINIYDEKDWHLIVAWLLGAMRPDGPYPILVLQGEQGSAKSTAAKVLRELIDPSLSPLRTTPREERDLAIGANNAWLLAYDNMSGIPHWLSDALCRVATGGGFATRTLYSDDEETIFDYTRPIIMNGIDEIVSRHDLLDRCILINLPVIPEGQRKDEENFWNEFNKAKGRVLGALLDALAEAIRNYNQVELYTLPRMADFAKWVIASENALPWPEGDFMNAYSGNQKEAVDMALDNDCVAAAVIALIEDRDEFEGTATELIENLSEFIDDKTQRSKAWPNTAKALGNRIRRSATFLRQKGIEVNFKRTCEKRLIVINEKTENDNYRHDCHNVKFPESEPRNIVTMENRMTQKMSSAQPTSYLKPPSNKQNDINDKHDDDLHIDPNDLRRVVI